MDSPFEPSEPSLGLGGEEVSLLAFSTESASSDSGTEFKTGLLGSVVGLTVTGTWMPTCTASLCLAAAEHRPLTKGELLTGLARESDSAAEEPI